MSGDRNRFSRSRSPKARWHKPGEEMDDEEEDDESAAAGGGGVELKTELDKASSALGTTVEESTTSSTGAVPVEKKPSVESLTSDKPDTAAAKQRKRKWLTGEASNTLLGVGGAKKPMTIVSSDTLKSYLSTNPNENLSKQMSEEGDEAAVATTATNKRRVLEPGEVDNHQQLNKQTSRTVILEESTKDELIYEDALNTSLEHNSSIPAGKTATPVVSMDPERSHPKSNLNMSPTRASQRLTKSSSSSVLRIRHLTRPFTVHQLKELLAKYGTLKSVPGKQPVEPYFWINSVKSFCYVAYDSEAEAEKARLALHSMQWPSSNPKQLAVDYSSMDELLELIEYGEDGPPPMARTKQANGADAGGAGGAAPVRAVKVREWDLPKMKTGAGGGEENGTKKERHEREREAGETVDDEDEVPAKTLDDLFKKTNTTPSIYWLPLSAEQQVEKCKLDDKKVAKSEPAVVEKKTAESKKTEEVKKEKVICHKRNFFASNNIAPIPVLVLVL